ncbi:hypothetical protein COO60DRAFT_1624422 [Scenedesmus sp. NREL 46B-D3]|nr:hypothetical protein COO60DRAFT_1624422 [Scenedesmus sp. NREL 46B-D3]
MSGACLQQVRAPSPRLALGVAAFRLSVQHKLINGACCSKYQLQHGYSRHAAGACRRRLAIVAALDGRERYGDAAELRDRGWALLEGWWACASPQHPLGHLLRIHPEYGRWTGKVFRAAEVWELQGWPDGEWGRLLGRTAGSSSSRAQGTGGRRPRSSRGSPAGIEPEAFAQPVGPGVDAAAAAAAPELEPWEEVLNAAEPVLAAAAAAADAEGGVRCADGAARPSQRLSGNARLQLPMLQLLVEVVDGSSSVLLAARAVGAAAAAGTGLSSGRAAAGSSWGVGELPPGPALVPDWSTVPAGEAGCEQQAAAGGDGRGVASGVYGIGLGSGLPADMAPAELNEALQTLAELKVGAAGHYLVPKAGLFLGTFGPHGPELLALSRGLSLDSGEEELAALKLTGDAHVPGGEVTFRVRIGRRHRRDGKGAYPPQLDVKARYPGEGRIASPGFTNKRWVKGELLVFGGGGGSGVTNGAQLGFVWNVPGEKRFLILLNRISLDC